MREYHNVAGSAHAFLIEKFVSLMGPADKGHSPFPSSERAVYGFALWLGSFLLLGDLGAPRLSRDRTLHRTCANPCRPVSGMGLPP